MKNDEEFLNFGKRNPTFCSLFMLKKLKCLLSFYVMWTLHVLFTCTCTATLNTLNFNKDHSHLGF